MPRIGFNRIEVAASKNCLVATLGTITTRLKRGDRRPLLEAQLFDPLGNPQDLNGVVAVRFRMRDPVSRAIVVSDQAAVVVSPGSGVVRYDWQAGDTDLEGAFEAWFLVEHTAGVVESFPNVESHKVVVEP